MKLSIGYFLLFFYFLSCKSDYPTKITQEELGRRLFFDNILSFNNTRSCGTCHNPQFAFTDSYKKSTGIYGDDLKRNSRPLFNLKDQYYFTAADSTLHTLETQMNNPFFNDQPHELGMKGKEQVLIERIKENSAYNIAFKQLFKNEKDPVHFHNIKTVIAAYIKSITSFNSRYDAYMKGNSTILTSDELKGMQLFFSEKLTCTQCHSGKNFDQPLVNKNYFNTGLYNVNNLNEYPSSDNGLYELTKNVADKGKFKVPTLRNLDYTKPYYHDGSAENLMDVINNYSKGGRTIEYGIFKGDGRSNLYKHPLIKPFTISEIEKKQLILFLGTLNDSTIVYK